MIVEPTLTQVPIWPAFMIHALRVLAQHDELSRRELTDEIQDSAGLSAEARAEVLKSGTTRATQRIGWALSNLGKASFIERPARATYRITPAGRAWMLEYPEGVDNYAEARALFHDFWPNSAAASASAQGADAGPGATMAVLPVELPDEDPTELIEASVESLNDAVGDELLTRLREAHPDFFEEAVVKLLLAMGYGGAEQRGKRIGGTADGGVDGVIDQDALGLDQVYVQAKRYAEGNTVGRDTVQAFIGALAGFGASRGVFITTSSFTAMARSYAEGIAQRVILIDGKRLVTLMLKYKVGVQVKTVYEVVELDEDFFD